MKKETYTFNVLVMPYEGGYMSLCKETGIIRQGSSIHEAREAMFSAMKTLIDAVCEDEKLEPSLSVGLPLKYRVMFHWNVFKMVASSTMDKLMYEKNSLQDFRPQTV